MTNSESHSEFPEFAGMTMDDLAKIFANQSIPLAKRMRVLWQLKAMSNEEAIAVLNLGFKDPSALLRHEVAYVLGQFKNEKAIPILTAVLEDTQEDCMVRHEAAEALGAIGCQSALGTLEKYLNDPMREVRETCEIAISRIKWESEKASAETEDTTSAEYASVDPAPAISKKKSTAELKEVLLNKNLSLFERYKAMFALRNKGDAEAVLALCEGFADDSALFRHEIAFVLGQVQHRASVDALTRVLLNAEEHDMVRHEAAEALGSIAAPGSHEILEQYKMDNAPAVRDSCIVALDMHDYWTQFNAPRLPQEEDGSSSEVSAQTSAQ